MAGVPTTALMRAMGHRSPIMTARYSEFADSQRRWAFAKADITKGISLPPATAPEPRSAISACSAPHLQEDTPPPQNTLNKQDTDHHARAAA